MRNATIIRPLVVCLTFVILVAVGMPSVRADATPNAQPARHGESAATNTPKTLMPTPLATVTAIVTATATHTPVATETTAAGAATVTGSATRTANATGTPQASQATQVRQVPQGRQPPPRVPNVATPNPRPPLHTAVPSGTPGSPPSLHPALPYRNADFMRGVNYISYSINGNEYATYDQIASNIAPSGANWVSIIPTCFQDTNQSITISCNAAVNNANGEYTPTDSDVVTAITKAHAAGLKVMLKPQIDVSNGYRGQIGFGTGAGSDANWTTWFNSYKTNVIGRYGPIAQTNNVEAFIIGTELVDTNTDPSCDLGISAQRGANWQMMVTYLRTLYTHKDKTGHELTKITYAANWGTYDCAEVKSVNWWGSLDYIGVDAYYPLTKAPNDIVDPSISPTVADLIAGWTDVNAPANASNGIAPTTSLGQISAANGNKKVLLTEVGYQSQRGTTQQPYGIFTQPDPPTYFAEQANAFEATFQALAGQPWLAGMFWWGAFITDPPFNPSTDNNYPFYGKPAEAVLRNYYGVANPQPGRR